MFAFLAAVVAAIFAQKTAQSQRESAATLEQLRARLVQVGAREHKAYHRLWKAINRYYRALKDNLEIGQYNENAVKEAESLGKEAEDNALLIQPSSMDEFYGFWQHANFIAETASDNRASPDKLRDLWRQENQEFTKKYYQLKDILSTKVRRLFEGS